MARLIDSQLCAEVGRETLPKMGEWLVVFEGSSGVDTPDIFSVNDSTGVVQWQNAPTPWWIRLVEMPLALACQPFFHFCFYFGAAWYYLRLPRCPYCRRKLRTRATAAGMNSPSFHFWTRSAWPV